MTENGSQPYHRQQDEPNLWYDRFQTYMLMGAGRKLTVCYRQVMNAERRDQGRPLLPANAKCPGSWRQRANQFDWKRRAAAYDSWQRRLALEKKEEAWMQAVNLAPEAVLHLVKTMRGELRDPDGSLTEGQNCTQRRLAAEGILNWADTISNLPDREDEYPEELRIREIRVHLTEERDQDSEDSEPSTAGEKITPQKAPESAFSRPLSLD